MEHLNDSLKGVKKMEAPSKDYIDQLLIYFLKL